MSKCNCRSGLVSNGDSSYVCNSLFSQGWCYLLFCSQCQLPTSYNSFRSVEFFMRIGSEFHRMKGYHFKYVFCLFKQVSIPCFSYVFCFFAIVRIFFSEIGDKSTGQTSSKDSMTMNLGRSAVSSSESDSDRFIFFCLKVLFILRWPCAPPATKESNLYW